MSNMERKSISKSVERELYAESMGKCMNPNCRRDLFEGGKDIGEKAHIVPYSETEDNSFDNLILLCPNCHKDYDKNSMYSIDELRSWKQIRKEETDRAFGQRFSTFEELQDNVAPLLEENKSIYKNYYLGNQKKLWDKFEPKILVNNRKIKLMLQNNLGLIQDYSNNNDYSNLEYIYRYINHIDEFEATRGDEEKTRAVLFPKEIDSMFGVQPIQDSFIESTESLEALIDEMVIQGRYKGISIGNDNPYIQLIENGKLKREYLLDTPRIRQLYYDYNCFRKGNVRFESLNYALKCLNSRGISFNFINKNNLREIMVDTTKILFIYEYVLSRAKLMMLAPEDDSIIVNLYDWNGDSCISTEAYELAKKMKVQLFTMDDFYDYINRIKRYR